MEQACDADARVPDESVYRWRDDLAGFEWRPTVLLEVGTELPNLAQAGRADRPLSVSEHVPQVSRDRRRQCVEPREVNGTGRLYPRRSKEGLDELRRRALLSGRANAQSEDYYDRE
jgi:hypothetical protein